MFAPTPIRKNPPTTVAAFRRAAEAAFLRSNDIPDVTLVWIHPAQAVVFPTGKRGFVGTLKASAPGYRTRTLHVSLCGSTLSGF